MRAATLWKHPLAWALTLLGCVVAAVSTLSYLGPAADPERHLHGLPLVLVTEDQGARGPAGAVNFGDRVAGELTRAADDGRLRWQRVATRAQAERLLDDQEAYAALVVPADFSRRSLALLGGSGPAGRRPSLEILGHTGTAGMATSMADKVLRTAAAQVSRQVGDALTAQASHPGKASAAGSSGAPPAGFLALLGDPVEVKETVRSTGGATGGATSGAVPLYFAIALLVSGLVPASLLTMMLDSRLGYVPLEVGPRRRQRPAVRITRTTTFLAKSLPAAVMGFAAGAVVALLCLWITDLDASDGTQFVLFGGAACASVTLVTLALFAAFGAPGQVVALLLLTLLGIPLSGAALPVEALPGALDTLGGLLPARHIAAGARSLLFFRSGDVSVQAWTVVAGYGLGALVLGLGVSSWYDRRGYHRAAEHEFQHRQSAVQEPVPVPS
ncbi:ABC transporter permease [Streptomyces sp. NPDC051921]|uniref:ABC transporter permease n=1 Tax=Streptomyces sp. NPDC051921 TaxID=3155806 RepID=UPI003430E358